MRVIHTVAAVVVGISLFGCASKPKAKPMAATPPLVTAKQHARQLQTNYEKTDSTARVGVVLAVKPDAHLAAVGDVPVSDFKKGDVLSFVDANRKLVANGQVKDIQKDLLIVGYDVPAKGRAPQVADLAVRLKSAK
jgi:hypothetical protein